jgi:hypothetical protein
MVLPAAMKHDDHFASGIKFATTCCDVDINGVHLMFHLFTLFSSIDRLCGFFSL